MINSWRWRRASFPASISWNHSHSSLTLSPRERRSDSSLPSCALGATLGVSPSEEPSIDPQSSPLPRAVRCPDHDSHNWIRRNKANREQRLRRDRLISAVHYLRPINVSQSQ